MGSVNGEGQRPPSSQSPKSPCPAPRGGNPPGGASCTPFLSRASCCATVASIGDPDTPPALCPSLIPKPQAKWAVVQAQEAARLTWNVERNKPGFESVSRLCALGRRQTSETQFPHLFSRAELPIHHGEELVRKCRVQKTKTRVGVLLCLEERLLGFPCWQQIWPDCPGAASPLLRWSR